jgi:predicted nucleic acid-binding protein
MIVHIDTSALIDALTGPRRSLPRLTSLVAEGHRVAISTLVLFEWLRGPRVRAEVAAQEALLPGDEAVPFSSEDARAAASLYLKLSRPRGREIDLAIAACALGQGAALWTLNPAEFEDVPGLRLV